MEFSLFKKKYSIIIISLVIIITFFTLYPCLENGFTNWDDDVYIIENTSIRTLSFQNIGQFFSSFYYGAYIPITIFSYAVDYHFSRLDPRAYHSTNIIFHLLNCILVFWMIFLISQNIGVSAITALFFGIHPLHVESVAWITERKDMLYSFFFLGTIISYFYYRNMNSIRFYYGALVLFLLSLLSKPVAITVPFILIAIDYIHNRSFDQRSFVEKIPFLVLSIAFIIIGFFAQHTIGAVRQISVTTIFSNTLSSTENIVFYLLKTIVPVKLSCLYPLLRTINPKQLNIFLFSPFIIGGLIILIILLSKHTKKIVFGGLFFLIALVPVLQIMPVGQRIADRYTYIPLIGIFYIFAEGLTWLFSKSRRVVNVFLVLLLVTVIGIFSFLARQQCRVWKDAITLWNNVIKNYPNIPLAYNNRGIAFSKMKEYEKAINDFNQTLKFNPNSAEVFNNRGLAYYFLEDYGTALSDFDKAIKIDTDYAEAYNNRGYVYYINGDIAEAINDFNYALRIKPDYATAYGNRGLCYLALRDFGAAIADFSSALEVDPFLADVYNKRGSIYYNTGDIDGAIADFSKALEINPRFAEAYNNRGIIYCQKGIFNQAIEDFNQALMSNPDYVEAYNNRGNAYSGLGKYDLALSDFNAAIDIDSMTADAYYNRAVIYFMKKEYNLALLDLKKFESLGYKVPKQFYNDIEKGLKPKSEK